MPSFLSRLVQHRLATAGGIVLIVLIAMALFAPWLAPHDPEAVHPEAGLHGPSWEYPLGQDPLGRCILSRMLYGARVSLSVGFLAGVLSLGVGIVMGSLAGYFGGWVDLVIMRLAEVFMTVPQFLLVIAAVAIVGPSFTSVLVIIGLSSWTGYARVLRGEILGIKQKPFVEAARAYGASDLRILARHVLPNCLAPLIVMVTLNVASVILLESSLSFLGFGIQEPQASWGSILSQGRAFFQTAPHVATFPGLAIMAAVLAFNLLGDGLRDALDPKLVEGE
ncbi:MAG TPA: peptide ABC transporter permease [Firmicutes bacterium]|jgi:ABC-type dipeptide/oligopeptide/nickel transport system permease subunit|nr:peptide ABC transporter permease [Bacillota bacterium]